MIDVNPTNTSDWRPDHGNERMNDTYGVDSSILDPRAVEDFDQFQASVDATRPGGGIEQGESSSVQNKYTLNSYLKLGILVTKFLMT